jgi:hypothetical protein
MLEPRAQHDYHWDLVFFSNKLTFFINSTVRHETQQN